jgi:tellurite resistance protein TerC
MLVLWVGFIAFILLVLALDLGVFHRKAHAVGVREALGWSAVWIALGLAFTVFVYQGYEKQWFGLGTAPDAADRSAEHPHGVPNHGKSAATKYVTGYVVEKSLSVDNVFVIAMIFSFLGVPAMYQHRVLYWGILGALVMRGAMIAAGTALIARFTWVLYLFGVFLIVTAVRMFFMDENENPEETWIVRQIRKLVPVTERFHGERFLVRAGSEASHAPAVPGAAVQTDRVVDAARAGTVMLTPLALALVMVETADVVFAVDSIPAIFAITADPFLVFTSNVFAILGLRSLYFALAGAIETFRYLKPALALVLAVVGIKMLTHTWLKQWLGANFNLYMLALILGILGAGVGLSWLRRPRHQEA